MEIKFRLTRNELEKAQREAFSRFRSRVERIISYSAATCLVPAVILSVWSIYRGHKQTVEQLSTLYIYFVLGISFLQSRTFSRQPDYQRKQAFDFQEYGIFLSPALDTKTKIAWTKITRSAETKDFFLLLCPWPFARSEPKIFWNRLMRIRPALLIIPKRAIPPADIGAFRNLTQRRLSVGAKDPALQTLRPYL